MGKFIFRSVFGIILAVLATAGPTVAVAQVSTVAAALGGVVTDSAGALVPGSDVTLRNIETGRERHLVSDSQGEFLATELPPGIYDVSVTREGFAEFHHSGITLLMGRSARLEITLRPATVQNQVTVTDQPAALEPTQSTLATNVETERIEELPVQSRNYLNFVLLAPGVSNSQGKQRSSTGQSGLGLADSGFSFGGLRGRSNSIAIDGLDNNDEFTGASRTELSLEIVREFQVVNSGISAESGGASGGAINVITKSGANILHGDAFLFLQNAATSARDPLADGGQHPDMKRYRAGFAIGGPIRKNRTFYYLAAEQEHTRQQQSSEIDNSARTTINSVISSGAFPGLRTRALTADLFNTSRAETELSGKIDHQLANNQSLMLRYAYTNNREAGDAFNTNSLSDFSARGSSFVEDHAIVGSLASLISPRLLNDLRFQVATRRVVLRTTDAAGPGIEISGIANFGRPFSGNGARRENHYQLTDTATRNAGTHLLKFGATANHVRLRTTAEDGFGGEYAFPDVAEFVSGRPQFWIQSFGDPRTQLSVTSYGGFIQDHWTPRRAKHLTLDIGLRYDVEQLPDGFPQDHNNFSPRLGIAYSPSDNWVARAAYGIYFDRYILAFLNRAEQLDGQHGFLQVAEGPHAAEVFQSSGGGKLAVPSAGIAPSVYRADPQLAAPYSQQVSTGVERLLTINTTISATYQFVRGVKLHRTVNVNLPPPVLLDSQNAASLGIANPVPQQIGRAVFGAARLNPAFDNIYELQDRASSSYHGLSLAVNHRFANEIAFSSSYTISKAMDDASDFDEQPQNPYDLRAERSVSLNDQRHRFVFSGVFDLPCGEEEEGKTESEGGWNSLVNAVLGKMEFAPILTVGSGLPVNPIVGFDANLSGAFPLSSRPLGYSRNSLRTPAVVDMDMRLVKYISLKPHSRLDLVVELFNVFNRANFASTNNIFGPGLTPTAVFGTPIESGRPRQAQFSIDFEF